VSLTILMGHKFYWLGGGVDKYFFDLCQLMERQGHRVITFAMRSESNLHSPFASYFAPNVGYRGGSVIARVKSLASFIYSPGAKKQIAKLVKDTEPQIAHFQHVYHQLTTSVFEPLRDAGVPIVQGVHDYKLGCPRYMLFNTRTNELCDACEGRNYFHAILSRCYDGSLLYSTMIAIESYYNRIFQTYQRSIDRFLVSNTPMKRRLVRYGISEERIVVIPNFVDVWAYEPVYQHDGYFLYFGRLSVEKGVEHLIRAIVQLKDQRLIIVGNGPDEPRLRRLVDDLDLNNVRFLGPLWGSALQPILEHATCVVVPSYWHENSPMVIYQSFAAGKPVIGSQRGGIPDLIDHDINGLLFEAGDVAELVQCMHTIAAEPQKQEHYSRQARLKAEREYTPEIHYNRIMQVYRDLGVVV
jgi:glycosyltransferase involved in cell wall biosynthesis